MDRIETVKANDNFGRGAARTQIHTICVRMSMLLEFNVFLCTLWRMSSLRHGNQVPRIYGVSEWADFVDQTARRLFGLSTPEFADAVERGTIEKSGSAADLASLLPLIDRLRSLS